MTATSNLAKIYREIELKIDELQRELEAAAALRAAGANTESDGSVRRGGSANPLPKADDVVTGLDNHIRRLEDIRELLGTYPELAQVVDSVIGKQTAASAQRQRRYTALWSVISLILGWLLSTFATPGFLYSLLHR